MNKILQYKSINEWYLIDTNHSFHKIGIIYDKKQRTFAAIILNFYECIDLYCKIKELNNLTTINNDILEQINCYSHKLQNHIIYLKNVNNINSESFLFILSHYIDGKFRQINSEILLTHQSSVIRNLLNSE